MPGFKARRVPLDSTAPYLSSLAREAAAGEVAAASKLMGYLEPTTRRVLAGILGSRCPDISEATAQVLVVLVQQIGAFREECHPAGVGARAALRIAKRIRARTLSRTEGMSYPATYRATDGRGRNRTEAFCRALDAMPAEQAEILGFRIVLGWSLSDIASATGAPLSTVRHRLHTAKESWRAYLAYPSDPSRVPGDTKGADQLHPEATLDALQGGEEASEANEIVTRHRAGCTVCRLESSLRADFEEEVSITENRLARRHLVPYEAVALLATLLGALSGGLAWLAIR